MPHPPAAQSPPPETPREPARRDTSTQSEPAPEKDLFEDPAHSGTTTCGRASSPPMTTASRSGRSCRPCSSGRPRRSYVVATVFALAWAACGVALAFLYLPDLQSVLKQGQAGIPAMIGLAGFVLAPIVFFYVLAYMMWRSQEMRLIAQSMAGVAMRLAEPEEVARDSVVTVGQAIRREVAAMGDGVERALARAAELEALVANEVSALERAYNDNEVRIRGLLETLAHQRDTLVGQAEQVRNAITGVHLDLSHDISSVSDHVAAKVNDSAEKIAQSLTEKGEHITLALGRAGDSMIGALGERGGDLLERLERASQETAHAIAGASDRLTASLNFKTDHITEEFAEMTTNLAQMMDGRLDEVTQGFAQKSLSHRAVDGRPLAADHRRPGGHLQPPRRNHRHHRRRGELDAEVDRRLARFSISACAAATSCPSSSRPARASPKPSSPAATRSPRPSARTPSTSPPRSPPRATRSAKCWRRACRRSRRCSPTAAPSSPRRSPATPPRSATSSPATSPSSTAP